MNATIADRPVALITGGASGIGAAAARQLSAEGRVVVLVDRDAERARLVADDIEANGGVAAVVVADVADLASCEAAVAQIDADFGRLDIVVCSAGIGGPIGPAWEIDPVEWYRTMSINLNGVFHTCRASIPLIRRGARGGRIVTLASIAGKEGNATASAYSAAKAGVIGFTKALGKELIDDGILVNAVAPGLIETPMTDQPDREIIKMLASKIPMGRLGRAEEVAELITWLCSDVCSFSTGAVYDISGGRATY